MDPNIRNINVVHLHSKLISIEMCLSDNNCLLISFVLDVWTRGSNH